MGAQGCMISFHTWWSPRKKWKFTISLDEEKLAEPSETFSLKSPVTA